jgi:hypothetical protein
MISFKKSGIIVLCLAVLVFAACQPEPEDEVITTISQIVIFNIPATIPVNNATGGSNPTYKIYVNASDSQREDMPPAAQGFMKRTGFIPQPDGTYAAVIPLRTPIINLKNTPNYNASLDPNLDNGPWNGTAMYFSITICPEEITAAQGKDAIWVMGGMDLNVSKSNLFWGVGLMNFRDPTLQGPPFNMAEKTKALYEDIICRDPEITKTP